MQMFDDKTVETRWQDLKMALLEALRWLEPQGEMSARLWGAGGQESVTWNQTSPRFLCGPAV